jgi:elongation factor Ts
VARSEPFRTFARSYQIAASAPGYVKKSFQNREHEREIARNRAREEGKPEAMLEKIVAGRIEKFKDEVVLFRQPYIRDESITIEQLLMQNVAAIGENIIVRRFERWELGESIEK